MAGGGRTLGAVIAVLVPLAIGGAIAGAVSGPAARPASASEAAVRLVKPARSFSVIAGGDVLTEARVRAAAAADGAATGRRFDFRPLFAEMRPVLESADLAICNMEIPIGEPGGAFGNHGRSPYGGNQLLAPHEIAADLRAAGFDRCSTASNHSFDVGVSGIASTLDALHANGITTVGTARTPGEAVDSVFEVDGIRVAHLSVTTFSNTVLPAEAWRLNHTRNPAVVIDAARSVRSRGAEVVVVSVHVSKELGTGPIPADRAFVTALASSVDAVFVHGPHVVQPFELVGDTPVWWSLGNFVSEMGPPSTGVYASARTSDGLLAYVEFTETVPGRFDARPESVAICNDFHDRTVRPAGAFGRVDLPERVRSELAACLVRTRSLVPTAR